MTTGAFGKPVSQAQVNGFIAEVLPQGCWGTEDYLWLTDHTRRPVELTDGYLEILPMPSRGHQRILAFLYTTFQTYLRPIGGEALFAPLRLRVAEGKFREPDLLLVRNSHDARSGDRFWTGADLVVEVVSPDNPERDFLQKREDYAEAGIPEYWIVDARSESITVLHLQGAAYVEHGLFQRQEHATSKILDAFGVDVDQVFNRNAELNIARSLA